MKTKTCRVPQEVKNQVDTEIRRCIKVAEKAFGRTFKFPTIKYDLRGTTAGWAQDQTNTININSILLMENLDTFIDGRTGRGTVTHEFAHLIDGLVYPQTRNRGWGRNDSIHGPTWKRIMLLLGATPSRCHSYDTTNSNVRTTAKHVYSCNGCGKHMTLGPVRHKKQQRHVDRGASTIYWNHGCGHHRSQGYKYLGLQATPKPKTTPKQKAIQTPALYPAWAANEAKPAPKKGSKLSHAVFILRQNPKLSRVKLIEMIRIACDMSQAGATTYYYNAKKAL